MTHFNGAAKFFGSPVGDRGGSGLDKLDGLLVIKLASCEVVQLVPTLPPALVQNSIELKSGRPEGESKVWYWEISFLALAMWESNPEQGEMTHFNGAAKFFGSPVGDRGGSKLDKLDGLLVIKL